MCGARFALCRVDSELSATAAGTPPLPLPALFIILSFLPHPLIVSSLTPCHNHSLTSSRYPSAPRLGRRRHHGYLAGLRSECVQCDLFNTRPPRLPSTPPILPPKGVLTRDSTLSTTSSRSRRLPACGCLRVLSRNTRASNSPSRVKKRRPTLSASTLHARRRRANASRVVAAFQTMRRNDQKGVYTAARQECEAIAANQYGSTFQVLPPPTFGTVSSATHSAARLQNGLNSVANGYGASGSNWQRGSTSATMSHARESFLPRAM